MTKVIKVICIYVDESHRLPLTLNHFYTADDTDVFSVGGKTYQTYYIYSEEKNYYYGIYRKEHFMTMEELAKHREQQMKDILDD